MEDRVSKIVRELKKHSSKEEWLEVCKKYGLKVTKKGSLDRRIKENKLILA
jgi:hypothetical protein